MTSDRSAVIEQDVGSIIGDDTHRLDADRDRPAPDDELAVRAP